MFKINIVKGQVTITDDKGGKIEMWKDQIHEFSATITFLAELIALGEIDELSFTRK